MIVAIDGPAASGKSSVARGVARALGFEYLDTGAMYRAVAWAALHEGVDLGDPVLLTELAHRSRISFEHIDGDPLPSRTDLDGRDVTAEIRTPEVDAAVSVVARVPGVREAMVALQRAFAETHGDIVAEGRDMGTTVFPSAEVKVFLTASTQERSHRRTTQLAQAGHDVAEDEVQHRLECRDEIDSSRTTSPLTTAFDAVVLDTTDLTLEQVTDRVLELVRGSE